MGSVKTVTNEYGSLEDRCGYDAFGKPYTGDLTSGMNLGYTGKPYDRVTGLYNYGYRDYQPEVARFTTVDPIKDGANWFAYVNNDPVNFYDSDGLFTFQIRVSVTIGGSTSVTAGIGFAIAWDPSDPLTVETGFYTTNGGGSHVGFGGSITGDITTSTNPKLSDLEGKSLISGASATVAPLLGITVETVNSLEGKAPANTASIGYSAGTTYEGHNYYADTKIPKKGSITLNPIVNKAKTVASAIVNFFSGSNKTNQSTTKQSPCSN
jgi:RHS repeat-associated protein